ncbi:MAG: hypothetical protein JXB26_12520 [Candidatus Aminicenantes bacterium]|nr:hypothetical protein [Candidatus Aminicenantes bacterium]
MRKHLLAGFLLFAFISLLYPSHRDSADGASSAVSLQVQNPQQKKPPSDYMSTYLSRNTNPLGLKEDQDLKRFLEQPSIKWAFRAEYQHVLE